MCNGSTPRSPRRPAALLRAFVACTLLACAALPARADVLVVAPHPDDDIITSAGVVLRARQAGETAWIVFMTNGDIDGEASGLARQAEAVAAQRQGAEETAP